MKLGIIGAMQIEIENLKPSIKGAKVEVISGIEFISGKIDGIDVVAAVSGIGKVFAAVCTEIMILHFGVEKVINIGVAGSLVKDLKVLNVAVAESAVQHDMNTTAIGDPAGLVSGINVINFDTDPELRNVVVDVLKAREIPYETGVIASGDLFVDTDRQRQNIHLKFNAIAADMEGGAIAHVCYINNIPFALIRSISDADGSAMDYNTFAGKAAEQSIAIVLDVIKKLK
ncbi:MAG: 5'-methylthioadenosine/adenosylhomocysteine nucleosidase [Pseudobutyrivibrio sp.]|jgi:adenosylhomocysteine nucleosidase|uniref:adenosylhomocysteine nucleosidase n=2 Tax=Pseudobutyrivibrio TaxID=46205 RepID=A0A2G3EAF0_9FIRM|nr:MULTISPECIES: 5'-methylthioadenosine/adenosylhomocysteine nucleosidase [Pseudobutyrivibrio]MBE5903628.1 5'-methylthioadenosine/adenosylhomocysteine nucleosidase [Pseudobutyrivibrio sp.]NEX01742.1 5'-methylthioadenosine/adenosylhomocysteine nucleosidase [Pseudobutyrivibrio xylanivorans]PHU40298.1 5'-methylthioadenosine/adenosylhomocysteine nucleosidase [Pseudobutyrivibrio ruminis]SCY43117.1 adenosylhomocysteine nucleosidase [Pseudobutyrivibrio sp. AR14]SFR71358.1 adenosylhomocysteine nucleos